MYSRLICIGTSVSRLDSHSRYFSTSALLSGTKSNSMPNRNRLHQSVKSVIVLWALTGILTIQAQLQDQYIGCFYDIGSQSHALSNDTSMTIEKCISSCQGTTYASIQNGNRCTCRNDYGVQVPDKYCSVTCTGNSSEFCGGVINLGHRGQQVAYVLYSACSIGMYGSNCNQACHCEGYIPCDRTTGNCPTGCYGNWNGPTCNSASVSQQYLGCYTDNVGGSRALEFMAYDSFYATGNSQNTIELCTKTCANNSYTYAGAAYTTQCFCGDSGYDRFGRLSESSCNKKCQGNSNEYCGGTSINSVYSVCPSGNYGNLCGRRCNCFNGTICTYRNGSCPSSQCSPGWIAARCDIRDCSTNNGACNETETCTMINLSYSSITACRCPAMKVRSRNNILGRLAGSTWGASARTLRTSALALSFSAAEYCCPVWERSAHTNLVDTQLNTAMRIITGTLRSASTPWLPVLSNIAPPSIRRRRQTFRLIEKALARPDLPLHDDIINHPQKRLPSRRPVWTRDPDDEASIESLWQEEWLATDIRNNFLVSNPGHVPPGFDFPRRLWSSLNRFRTGHGRCAEDMFRWGQTDSPLCQCGATQSMYHIVEDCPFTRFPGGIRALHEATPACRAWLSVTSIR